MYHRDHAPAHFHVRYGDQKALVGIDSLTVLEGNLSPRALNLVTEWAALHKHELRQNWERAQALKELRKIEPLK